VFKNLTIIYTFRILSFLPLIICSATRLYSQDTGFPENWGRWKTRILLTAENLGPNALPVPEIRNGSIFEKAFFELSGCGHKSSVDKTINPFFKLSLPFAEGKVAVEVWSAFAEYFEADTSSLTERKAWNKNSSGYSGGDIYFATLIQVLKDHHFLPDILVSINLKTASGNNLESLRHTDSPGYHFDLSMGKSFKLGENYTLKPFGLFGLYVYQTHQVMALQNDALLWGGGVVLSGSVFELNTSIGGYHGYFNQGDRPIVARLSTQIHFNNSLSGVVGIQQGIHDFDYTSFNLGVYYRFLSFKPK